MPSSYFPVRNPHASGDHVIVPKPGGLITYRPSLTQYHALLGAIGQENGMFIHNCRYNVICPMFSLMCMSIKWQTEKGRHLFQNDYFYHVYRHTFKETVNNWDNYTQIFGSSRV